MELVLLLWAAQDSSPAPPCTTLSHTHTHPALVHMDYCMLPTVRRSLSPSRAPPAAPGHRGRTQHANTGCDQRPSHTQPMPSFSFGVHGPTRENWNLLDRSKAIGTKMSSPPTPLGAMNAPYV